MERWCQANESERRVLSHVNFLIYRIYLCERARVPDIVAQFASDQEKWTLPKVYPKIQETHPDPNPRQTKTRISNLEQGQISYVRLELRNCANEQWNRISEWTIKNWMAKYNEIYRFQYCFWSDWLSACRWPRSTHNTEQLRRVRRNTTHSTGSRQAAAVVSLMTIIRMVACSWTNRMRVRTASMRKCMHWRTVPSPLLFTKRCVFCAGSWHIPQIIARRRSTWRRLGAADAINYCSCRLHSMPNWRRSNWMQAKDERNSGAKRNEHFNTFISTIWTMPIGLCAPTTIRTL